MSLSLSYEIHIKVIEKVTFEKYPKEMKEQTREIPGCISQES